MSVNAVSQFNTKTRFTRKGNPYQKTNTAKIVGAALSAGYTGINIARNSKVLNKAIYSMVSQIKNGAYIESAAKTLKASAIISAVTSSAIFGLGLGAIVDGITNKIRAHKADQANA